MRVSFIIFVVGMLAQVESGFFDAIRRAEMQAIQAQYGYALNLKK